MFAPRNHKQQQITINKSIVSEHEKVDVLQFEYRKTHDRTIENVCLQGDGVIETKNNNNKRTTVENNN